MGLRFKDWSIVLCCVVSDIGKELYPSLNALPTEGVHKI